MNFRDYPDSFYVWHVERWECVCHRPIFPHFHIDAHYFAYAEIHATTYVTIECLMLSWLQYQILISHLTNRSVNQTSNRQSLDKSLHSVFSIFLEATNKTNNKVRREEKKTSCQIEINNNRLSSIRSVRNLVLRLQISTSVTMANEW